MRVTRTKAARKTLAFYRLAFKVVPPYQVLVDGNFLYYALTIKTSVLRRISKLFGKSEIKLFAPRAVIHELEALGERCAPALDFCSKHCTLIGERSQVPAEAIFQFAAKGHYVVATQDEGLRQRLRQLPGVPICFFSGTILSLEPPSRTSLRSAAKTERQREKPDQTEAALARRLRKEDKSSLVKPEGPVRRKKKKKRGGGPNPLSCMKSTKRR